jgi:hypothetical protein
MKVLIQAASGSRAPISLRAKSSPVPDGKTASTASALTGDGASVPFLAKFKESLRCFTQRTIAAHHSYGLHPLV